MTKAILFDRDGVLIKSAQVHIDSVVKSFNELEVYITEAEKMYVVGRNPNDYVNYFLKKYNFSKEKFLEKQSRYYQEIFPGSFELIEETISLAKELKKRGYLLALITSSDKPTTNIFFEKAGLIETFDAIVTVEECPIRKPSPEPYLLAAKRLNVNPSDCLVVEDSYTGLESAKNAGMDCVVIPNEHTKNQDFSKADNLISNPEEILKILSS